MITKVVLAKLSPTMEEGTIVKWSKQEGDAIKVGDVLAEIETDKANMEMEALGSGVLRKVLVAGRGQGPGGRSHRRDRRPGRGHRGDAGRGRGRRACGGPRRARSGGTAVAPAPAHRWPRRPGTAARRRPPLRPRRRAAA